MAYELSIIIPTWNKAAHLRRNLQSLSIQTFDHAQFEALVIDDGSTDDTTRVVNEARARYDYRLRYVYLNRAGDTSPALSWNVGAKRAESPLIVHMGADIIAAKDALALLYSYQQDSDGEQMTFGQCYRLHSKMSNALLDHTAWQENIHLLETLFVVPFHHSSYWRVPMLAAVPRLWYERLHGFDESYPARTWSDDADFWVRLEASGVVGVNALDVWGAHQYHEQRDVRCNEGCPCPLCTKSKTAPGPNLKYNGSPEDLMRNLDHWGEYEDSIEY